MRIDIWSDVICPFCYIGKANLETALAEAGVQAELVHHAFRLMPGDAPYPVEQMFARRYGQGPAQAAQSLRNVEATAARSGLEFHLDGTLCGDTTDAHKLLALAADKGLQITVLERFYRAYFTENRNVFDREVLMDLGSEAGLDRDDMLAAFASPDLAARVEADQQQAQSLNVRGVPFFVIGNRIAVSGAQPPSAFSEALKFVAAADAPQEGQTCGPDSCDIA
ncbi:MAG: DsbA family oxidoreductase [Asticcacaulis sp.]|nr:DsbA family oxidoreductase [Asticcacaulis sp.]